MSRIGRVDTASGTHTASATPNGVIGWDRGGLGTIVDWGPPVLGLGRRWEIVLWPMGLRNGPVGPIGCGPGTVSSPMGRGFPPIGILFTPNPRRGRNTRKMAV